MTDAAFSRSTYPPFHPEFRQTLPAVVTLGQFRALFPAENEFVEWKAGASARPLQEAVTAFSNTDGGVILIGVQDDGTVTGRELTPGVEDALHGVMREVHDPGRYAIHSLLVGSTPITVVSVARRVEGFAQTSSGRVTVRRGTTKVALIGSELTRFVSSRSLRRFEDSDSGVPTSHADPGLLEGLGRAFGGWDTPGERLADHGLVVAGDPNSLSIAGALYLLEDPAQVLGKAYIEILRYQENEREYDRRVEVRGPLPRLLVQAVQAVTDELGSELVVLGVQRHELPRLPPVVLREVIANALAHRSYELTGTAVRIELRPHAVTISSPGGLPEPVTVENMREAQAARNLHTITALRRYGLAEDAGRGIDVILDSMRQELLDAPDFQDTGHSVIVTLPIRSAVAPIERAWIREVEHRGLIEPIDRHLLIEAARGRPLTNTRVRKLLGVDAHTARVALQRLRDAGFLLQHGERGGTQYALTDSLRPPAGLRLSVEDLEDLVVKLARERARISNADVRAATGLARQEALSILERLVAQRRLVRRGERRGTHYIVASG